MAKVSSLIQKYITEVISLDLPDISKSSKTREWVKSLLKSEIDRREGEPKLFGEKPFLHFGSYFKGTKVSNVDEFDILVVIDSSNGQYNSGGKILGHGLGNLSPNPKYSGKYNNESSLGVSPKKMVSWLKNVATEAFKNTGVDVPEEDGPAVTLYIGSSDTKLDLVPAGIFSYPGQDRNFYNILDGSGRNNWLATAPHEDMEHINSHGSDKNDFKNVIRICKRIRSQYDFGLSSYAIELVALDYVNKFVWSDDISLNLKWLLIHFREILESGSLIDIYSPSRNNLLDGLEGVDIFIKLLESLIRLLNILSNQDISQESGYELLRNNFENNF